MVKYYINEEEVKKIRFPVTEIGDKTTIPVMVENTLGEIIELIPYAGDMEVSVKEYPRYLNPGEKKKTVWVFAPTEKRLRTVEGNLNRYISLKAECGFKEIAG